MTWLCRAIIRLGRGQAAGRNRGQALVELALTMPIIAGLFALTLQGGLTISDQVQLEHFAYEGAQWAFAQRADPTVTTATVADHVKQQMCGGVATIPSTQATTSRFCTQEPSGISNLSVTVSSGAMPVASSWPFDPVVDAQAAGCKPWAITLTPSNPVVPVIDPQGSPPGRQVYAVNITRIGSGTDVNIHLSGGNYPSPLAAAPVFNPPDLDTNTHTSGTLTIAGRADTTSGIFNVFVAAVDTCAPVSVGHAAYSTVLVKPNIPTLPPPGGVSIDGVKASLLPIYICLGVDFTITGHNFQPGAIVRVGKDLAATVTPVGIGEVIARFTGLPSAGTNGLRQDLTITNPDGTTATMVNAVTVAPFGSGPAGLCGAGGTTPEDCLSNCSASTCAANCSTSCVAHCSFPNCTSNCSSACTSDCSLPSCTVTCSMPNCAKGCGSSCVSACSNNCAQYCNQTSCLTACQGGNCALSCSSSTVPVTYNGCAGAAGSYLLTVTAVWNEPLVIPLLTNSTQPYFQLTAVQEVACQ